MNSNKGKKLNTIEALRRAHAEADEKFGPAPVDVEKLLLEYERLLDQRIGPDLRCK